MNLYPECDPYRTWTLEVGQGHRLQVYEWGQPTGLPALLLHGGPGSGCSPWLPRCFDPQRFRVIGFDQRGSGRSTPRGATEHNTTAFLLADLRLLRQRLDLPRCLVLGGSWGATLALAHALDQPQAVSALMLRAVFLPLQKTIDAFFAGGPTFAELLDGLSGAADAQRLAALRWWRHERERIAGPDVAAAPDLQGDALQTAVDRYRVQAHYLQHRCWLDDLLQRCAALPPVPSLLLHARDDRVCPPADASALALQCPGLQLQWVERGGHDPTHPLMAAAMVAALDHYARHSDFEMPTR